MIFPKIPIIKIAYIFGLSYIVWMFSFESEHLKCPNYKNNEKRVEMSIFLKKIHGGATVRLGNFPGKFLIFYIVIWLFLLSLPWNNTAEILWSNQRYLRYRSDKYSTEKNTLTDGFTVATLAKHVVYKLIHDVICVYFSSQSQTSISIVRPGSCAAKDPGYEVGNSAFVAKYKYKI